MNPQPIAPAVPLIRPREREAVLQSLQAGLVPKQGIHLIQVGRQKEVQSILKDIETIKGGGAAFRFVIGLFGGGKSFFLSLIRAVALQNRLVVASADISMERRFYASGGQARALYAEIMRNMAIKVKPDGGALRNICEGWIAKVREEVVAAGGDAAQVAQRLRTDLRDLKDYVGGYEFTEVLVKYFEGYNAGDENIQDCALRWLRGEYATKTEARQALGVRRIIDDESFYDSLKLMAAFVRKAGYGGLLINLDELVVLSHRIPNGKARQANYEALLTILNDCYQGSAQGIGFVLAGTDRFLEDQSRGLYSYEALRSRLSIQTFGDSGVVDLAGPVIRLPGLTPEDLYVLLSNVATVHANGDRSKWVIPPEAIKAVLDKANNTMGAEFFRTPRDVVRAFVGLLNVVEQNPGMDWKTLLGGDFIQKPAAPMSAEEAIAENGATPDDDNLATFELGKPVK